jgi:hypothetical protein
MHGNPFTGPSLRRRAFLIPPKEVRTMIKGHIKDRCEYCDGIANVPAGEAESLISERYYLPVSLKRRLALP